MAPFRASRSSRFGRPGIQGDVDIIDGLPVRQWRLQEGTVGSASTFENAANPSTGQSGTVLGPGGWPELPMPKGSNLYAPWCQQLLRAARAGRVKKRKEHDSIEDDKENEHEDEYAPAEPSKNGFVAQRWAPVPRRLEETEPEYLAKRRKGLPSAYGSGGHAAGSNADALTADGVPSGDEPVRKRAPPPRRKPKKGLGKRKKLVAGEGIRASAAGDATIAQSEDQGTKDGKHVSNTASGGADQDEDDEDDDEDEEEGDDGEEEEADEHSDDDREEGEIKEEGTDAPEPGPEEEPQLELPEPPTDVQTNSDKPAKEQTAETETNETNVPLLEDDNKDMSTSATMTPLPGLDLHNEDKA